MDDIAENEFKALDQPSRDNNQALINIIHHQEEKINKLEKIFKELDETVEPSEGILYCDKCDMPNHYSCDSPDYTIVCSNNNIILCDKCIVLVNYEYDCPCGCY